MHLTQSDYETLVGNPLNDCPIIEHALEEHLHQLSGHSRLIDAMKYATLNGGKRIRARLVLASALLFDVDIKQALQAGVAVEFIHAYSLAHDDLPAMDDDDLRRNKPTLHLAFDEATAIMAGNALLGEAFRALTDPRLHPSSDKRLSLIQQLIYAVGPEGLLGGQMMDLAAEGRFSEETPELTLPRVRAIQLSKTGALFRFSCLVGPLLADEPNATHELFSTIADHIGYAFQIKDDLLDLDGAVDKLGKAVGKDEGANKATLIRLLGKEAAEEALKYEVSSALNLLKPYGQSAYYLNNLVGFIAERHY